MEDANSVIGRMSERIISTWRVLREIHSDPEIHLNLSRLTKQMCQIWGIKPRFHTPYHPQSSRKVERANRTVNVGLKKMITEYRNHWVKHLAKILIKM